MPKLRLSRLRPRIQGIGHKIRKPLSLHGKFPFPQTGRFCRKLTLRVCQKLRSPSELRRTQRRRFVNECEIMSTQQLACRKGRVQK